MFSFFKMYLNRMGLMFNYFQLALPSRPAVRAS